MIDYRNELKNFRAINLDNIEENVPDITDDVKNSLMLYNSALENLNKDSEDIAIIELKKAVALNPNFSEAYNLLGLSYAYTGEIEKATEIFDKVIESESNGINALIYKRSIVGVDPNYPVQLASSSDAEKIRQMKRKNKKKKTRSGFLGIAMSFIFGVILMSIICYPYLSNQWTPNSSPSSAKMVPEDDYTELQESYNTLQADYEELNVEKKTVEQENEQLKQQIEEIKSQATESSITDKLLEVNRLANEQNFESAADLLISLKNLNMDGQDKLDFDGLVKEVLPVAAINVYEEGKNLCQVEANFAEGLAKLLKVKDYDSRYKPDGVMYYTAKCYQGLSQYDKAKALYNQIKEQFPNGFYKQYIPIRLNEIEQAENQP
ncbi:MAG: tetratricopeptide repeat protein [Eubacteriales bacterium]|nr:tetratricopeptide repeat protein [Eubacteriales bacterium]